MVGFSGVIPPNKKLGYAIHKWSSHSGDYHPNKIMIDNPYEQQSRWQSGSNLPPQFIILKLNKPSIVRTITFGKFHKTHVCNLKCFKVYGGIHDEGMIELCEKGLKNDSRPETFDLIDKFNGSFFPSQYIKIVPVATWGPTAFNYSIWYVALSGIEDPAFVNPCMQYFEQCREERTIKLCLKHLRQHNYSEAFQSLQKRTKIQLEHPMLSQLHHKLVECGDYDAVETLLDSAINQGYMEEYTSRQYTATWEQINVADNSPRPGTRGGHPMCIDEAAGLVYLFGGWDGKYDLADFWEYASEQNRWRQISTDTEMNNGPCCRSCHKMVLDSKHKLIYVLGRYLESSARENISLKSDFYCYDIQCDEWSLLSSDTASEGGPELIYDHQMVLDKNTQCIYIFGGKVLSNNKESDTYSGLYRYHIPSNTWSQLKSGNDPTLRSRIGHSMLYHPNRKQLFVFAGQREHFLDDFVMCNVERGTVETVPCTNEEQVPESGYTMRATIDTQHEEIHMLSGLSKDHRNKNEDNARTTIWVYSLKWNKWSRVKKVQSEEPCARFAHMLVYDSYNKVHYMFGGNPGPASTSSDSRLDDFWRLKIERPASVDIRRKFKFLVRQFKFKDMSLSDPVGALIFLQQHVENVVNHSSTSEESEFQELVLRVFNNNVKNDTYAIRTELFDQLMEYFPDHMAQPRENLTDFVPPI